MLKCKSKVINGFINIDLKLFYIDVDGDIISVTCQSDMDEAF